jgi:hypothetical protein
LQLQTPSVVTKLLANKRAIMPNYEKVLIITKLLSYCQKLCKCSAQPFGDELLVQNYIQCGKNHNHNNKKKNKKNITIMEIYFHNYVLFCVTAAYILWICHT